MTRFQRSVLEFVEDNDDDYSTLMGSFWVHMAEKFGENKTHGLWEEYYMEDIDFKQWRRNYTKGGLLDVKNAKY